MGLAFLMMVLLAVVATRIKRLESEVSALKQEIDRIDETLLYHDNQIDQKETKIEFT